MAEVDETDECKAEINKRYEEVMKIAHPDNGGNKQWAEQLNNAKDVLLDDELRESYNEAVRQHRLTDGRYVDKNQNKMMRLARENRKSVIIKKEGDGRFIIEVANKKNKKDDFEEVTQGGEVQIIDQKMTNRSWCAILILVISVVLGVALAVGLFFFVRPQIIQSVGMDEDTAIEVWKAKNPSDEAENSDSLESML